MDLEETALTARAKFFKSIWKIEKSLDCSPIIKNIKCVNHAKQDNDIIIAFHEDDLVIADLLKTFILSLEKNLTIKFSIMGPQSDGYKSMVDFERANLIIILLNPYYISTKSCLTQLQIAMSLHRRQSGSGLQIFPLILESLPGQPSYIHLLPSHFKADDEIFQKLINKYGNSDQLRRIMDYKHKSYSIEKAITMKAIIMLYFAASWIAKVLFRHK